MFEKIKELIVESQELKKTGNNGSIFQEDLKVDSLDLSRWL